MRTLLATLIILSATYAAAQEGYTAQTRRALQTMWKYQGTDSTGFDTAGYRQALALYEEAFARYPDSIEYVGYYKASVLAGKLGQLDKAFGYLAPLARMTPERDDHEGWVYLLGRYTNYEYGNLLDDPRWKALASEARMNKDRFYDQLAAAERELLATKPVPIPTTGSGLDLYTALRNYAPYLPKERRGYSVTLPLNDSTSTSYYVQLPRGYDPDRSYPLLVVLHGAVRYNRLAEYMKADILEGWNRFYTEYADQHGVILAFPKGSRQYNWMTSDDGFGMVPDLVRQLKTGLNVDDNRVFLTGHSNGATGSFSYLMKAPTLFAGFYGLNTYPRVFTGGTFIENARNRSFLNFSTDQDYYYPPAANDRLSELTEELKIDYRDVRYVGFPHWFPEFGESEAAYRIMFSDLDQRKRDPFPPALTWEFDDPAHDAVDWLSDIELDTTRKRAAWHEDQNFRITEWLEYDDNDSLITVEVDRLAFPMPRPSGKIEATYADNTFRVRTSHIGDFTILISPEMVDLERPVRIYRNGSLVHDSPVSIDDAFTVSRFTQQRDRVQLWVNHIRVAD